MAKRLEKYFALKRDSIYKRWLCQCFKTVFMLSNLKFWEIQGFHIRLQWNLAYRLRIIIKNDKILIFKYPVRFLFFLLLLLKRNWNRLKHRMEFTLFVCTCTLNQLLPTNWLELTWCFARFCLCSDAVTIRYIQIECG